MVAVSAQGGPTWSTILNTGSNWTVDNSTSTLTNNTWTTTCPSSADSDLTFRIDYGDTTTTGTAEGVWTPDCTFTGANWTVSAPVDMGMERRFRLHHNTFEGNTVVWAGGGTSYWATPVGTPEEVERQRLRELKRTLLARREDRAKRVRGEELLRLVLNKEEITQWKRYGAVRVVGSKGGYYEIGAGWCGMIYELELLTGKPIKKLCAHIPSDYCVQDRVAALVLELKADEERLRKKALTHKFNRFEKERVAVRRMHKAAA